MEENMMTHYIRHLETRYAVSVNQDAINQLLAQANASR
jgi:hypothetical protein